MVEKPSGETIDFWSHPTLGRTLATIDFNNDGRPDLVANHLDAPVALLENRTQGGRWLRLDLVGTTSERDSIGAKVVVKDGNETWTAWVVGGDGYLCTNESTIDIGVGKLLAIETVEIFWPSGMHQAFNDVATNQSYLLIESDDRIFPR